MKYLKLILFILLHNIGYNQYLPYLGPNQILSHKDESIILTADLTQCALTNPNETTDYTVSDIPYINQINNGVSIISPTFNQNDFTAGPFNIGFNFCFFGQTYDKFWVDANGWISFTAPTQTWYDLSSIPNSVTVTPKNSIMGAYADWFPFYPGMMGQIKYQLQGIAPFRKLIVSYIDIPMLICSSNTGTFHIIIYESTNIIETHIKNKPVCLQWDYGKSVEGIQNLAGDVAFTVPGRNHTVWTAQNDSKRFTPSGNEIQPILTWYEIGNPNPIGTGTSITVTPLFQGTSYTCHLEYSSCFSNWSNLTCLGPDTITINYEFNNNNPSTPYIIEHPIIDSLIEIPEQPIIDLISSTCYIPNSFTPDGDEHNNVFKPIFNDEFIFNKFSFMIYNTWGELIYKSFDPNSYWDGSYNNKICPSGVYIYIVNINNKTIHGHVNLIK
jgi:gliding motility-associated-like protein